MSVSDLTGWVGLFLAFSAAITVLIATGKWLGKRVEQRIVEVIVDSTSQIKTDANGGQSLNDVARGLKALTEALHTHIDEMREVEHKRDIDVERLHYELALVKRVASYPALGEEEGWK